MPFSPMRKIGILIATTMFMALGVAMTVKSGLGTSPISSVPYVISLISPLSIGTATVVLNCLIVALQFVILGKDFHKDRLIQIPAAFFFGYAVDIVLILIDTIQVTTYLSSCCICMLGIVFIAIGVSIEGYSGIVLLAGEGISLAISTKTGKNYGNIKIAVDMALVACAAVISFVSLRKIEGIREGTLASAVLVGFLAKNLIKFFFNYRKRKGGKDEQSIASNIIRKSKEK